MALYVGRDVSDTSLFQRLQGLSVKAVRGDAVLFYALQANGSTDLSSEHGSCPVIKARPPPGNPPIAGMPALQDGPQRLMGNRQSPEPDMAAGSRMVVQPAADLLVWLALSSRYNLPWRNSRLLSAGSLWCRRGIVAGFFICI